MPIPIIDMDKVASNESDIYIEAINDSLENYGAFVVVNHGLDKQIITQAHSVARTFFEGPDEHKLEVSIAKSQGVRGYFAGEAIISNPNLSEEGETTSVVERKYEAFEIGFEPPSPVYNSLQSILLMANVWPRTEGFRPAMQSYYRVAMELGHKLSRIVALSIGLDEEFFIKRASMPLSQMRVLYYKGNPSRVLELESLGSHTDYECLTIINSSVGGLEVCDRAGNWLEIEAPSDGLIVLVGDVVEVLSNGVFRAARHRVRQPSQERISLVFFYGLDYETVLTPTSIFQEIVGIERFLTMHFGEHMIARSIANYPHLKHMIESGSLVVPFECAPRNPLNAIRERFNLK